MSGVLEIPPATIVDVESPRARDPRAGLVVPTPTRGRPLPPGLPPPPPPADNEMAYLRACEVLVRAIASGPRDERWYWESAELLNNFGRTP